MSLDKVGGGRQKEKSKVILVDMPANNNDIKTAIDAELDNGWHIDGLFHDTVRDKLRVIFTKPKRN
jgi:hypothetical protein